MQASCSPPAPCYNKRRARISSCVALPWTRVQPQGLSPLVLMRIRESTLLERKQLQTQILFFCQSISGLVLTIHLKAGVSEIQLSGKLFVRTASATGLSILSFVLGLGMPMKFYECSQIKLSAARTDIYKTFCWRWFIISRSKYKCKLKPLRD